MYCDKLQLNKFFKMEIGESGQPGAVARNLVGEDIT